jgi:hypothetical protein
MTKKEKLFETHNTRLSKVAAVFAYKSRGTIEREEFYQEFAVRLLTLNKKYFDKPEEEFIKILNFSLHNLACDMLRNRFRFVCFDPADTANQSIIATTVVPSFLYFYKEAVRRLIQDALTLEIYDWLIENPEKVERVRKKKNLESFRIRRVALEDVVDCVTERFKIVPCCARHHVRVIKASLKQIWRYEYAV